MCLIAFAIGASKRWPLVIASNRDEFLDRPTLPLDRWKTPGGQEIISGRDLRAGGTWLGMSPGGRVAFLTNVREAGPKNAAFSRGELVTRWLESHSNAEAFSAFVEKDQHRYSGFNLVIGDVQRNAWTWMTNRGPVSHSGWHCETLASGIYGLSNAALDTPWPKTLALKSALNAALRQSDNSNKGNGLSQDLLWTVLGNCLRAPFHSLPATGVSQSMEAALSSAFVDFPEHGYGTRSSTILVASKLTDPIQGKTMKVDVTERTYSRSTADEIHVDSTTLLNFC